MSTCTSGSHVVHHAVILIITQAGYHWLHSHFAYSAAELLHGHLRALHSAAQTTTATVVVVGTLQATCNESHLVIIYCQLLDC